jgi:hypothetical protein
VVYQPGADGRVPALRRRAQRTVSQEPDAAEEHNS